MFISADKPFAVGLKLGAVNICFSMDDNCGEEIWKKKFQKERTKPLEKSIWNEIFWG